MTRDPKSEALLARYADGERAFTEMDLDDQTYDFSDADLRGAIFTGSFIVASFKNANLERADFSSCNVKTCDFSGARLAEATFFNSAISGAEFDGANLTGADFEGADCYGIIFKKGELSVL